MPDVRSRSGGVVVLHARLRSLQYPIGRVSGRDCDDSEPDGKADEKSSVLVADDRASDQRHHEDQKQQY